MNSSKAIKTILWKEILDLSRDYKTLAAVIILPLISLPSLALITSVLYVSQRSSILIIVEDQDFAIDAITLKDIIVEKGRALKLELTVNVNTNKTIDYKYSLVQADVLAIIPRGFKHNITMLDGQAIVKVSRLVGSPASDIAYNALQWALYDLSVSIVNERIRRLAEYANISIKPEALRNPILIETGYHLASGVQARVEEATVAFTARILQFSLFFVVYPAVVFMSDAILGERERRTIEKLLVSPLSRRDLLAGKMLASMILGIIAALADSLALLLFFILAGEILMLSVHVLIAWIISVIALIALTSAITSIVSSRSETTRSAQILSFAILSIAMIIYFASLLVDLTKVPVWASTILQLIPFTHASLAIYRVSTGDILLAVIHLLILYSSIILLVLLAVREFNSERLLLFRG
ncbi:MAG: ABC transporter permease [Acidilobaceae archaeon]